MELTAPPLFWSSAPSVIFPDESSVKRLASTIVVLPLEPERKKDQLPVRALRLKLEVCGNAKPRD